MMSVERHIHKFSKVAVDIIYDNPKIRKYDQEKRNKVLYT